MNKGREKWRQKWSLVFGGLAFIIATITIAISLGAGGHVLEWLGLLVRWFHVVIGIAWIGASFYFIWLENNLEREPDKEIAGKLWAVHGGGFYYVEKYKLAPKELPKQLHWFQWEAYLTWISGLGLLIIVYYANAKTTMLKPSGLPLPAYASIVIGLSSLVIAWIIYDRMCRSGLIKRPLLFSLLGFSLVVISAFGLNQLLSARAAYIHIGAMLGTLMAGNVFFTIIPAQRALVRAASDGTKLDPSLGKHASLRSLHNNYMTLPVIFIMISNHFPSTFGHQYNWLVLGGLFLASTAIRHYLNLHERGKQANWILPIASALVLSLALMTAPRAKPSPGTSKVTLSEVQVIIETRCLSCHSRSPTDPSFQSAPKGIRFDSLDDILRQKERIYQTAVLSDYMPLGNKTGMLAEERDLLARWILNP